LEETLLDQFFFLLLGDSIKLGLQVLTHSAGDVAVHEFFVALAGGHDAGHRRLHRPTVHLRRQILIPLTLHLDFVEVVLLAFFVAGGLIPVGVH